MKNSQKKDVHTIEVLFRTKKQKSVIRLIEPMNREDALKIAKEIKSSGEVLDVKCFVTNSAFI
jgi:hypothetical protein